MQMPSPNGPIQRVVDALAAHGLTPEVRQFDASTRTAAEAAAALGVEVGRIVKSLVFTAGDSPIVVLTSGSNRVDIQRLAAVMGAPVRRADADTVRAATGFAIGGVPPLGHARPLPVVIDRDLLRHEEVWAAAGTGNTVFPIRPPDLVRVSGGTVADVAVAGDGA